LPDRIFRLHRSVEEVERGLREDYLFWITSKRGFLEGLISEHSTGNILIGFQGNLIEAGYEGWLKFPGREPWLVRKEGGFAI